MSRQQELHVETAEQPVCRISGKQGDTCKNPKYGSAPLLLWIFHPVKLRLQPFIAAFLVDPSVYQNQYDKRNKDIAQYPLWLVENIQMPCSLTVKTVEYDSREQHDIDILHNCNSRKGTVRQAMFGRIPWPIEDIVPEWYSGRFDEGLLLVCFLPFLIIFMSSFLNITFSNTKNMYFRNIPFI